MEAEKKQAEEEERTYKELYDKEMKSRQEREQQQANTLREATKLMDEKRRHETKLDNNFQTALQSILWYPMLSDEWSRCTQGGNHFDRCPTVEEGFNRYSNLRVNPALFQFDSGKWVNTSGGGTWTYSRASDLRKAAALCQNRWFTKSELESHIRSKFEGWDRV